MCHIEIPLLECQQMPRERKSLPQVVIRHLVGLVLFVFSLTGPSNPQFSRVLPYGSYSTNEGGFRVEDLGPKSRG